MLPKTIREELKELLSHLEKEEIEYMITGSSVLSTYATPRFTRDIDIVINLDIKDASRFLKFFIESDFSLNAEAVKKDIELKRMFNLISNKTLYKYDFVIKRSSPIADVQFSRKRYDQVFEVAAWVISLEDLIVAKLICAQNSESPIQILDLELILLDTKPDMNYIKDWCEKLNLKTFNLFK